MKWFKDNFFVSKRKPIECLEMAFYDFLDALVVFITLGRIGSDFSYHALNRQFDRAIKKSKKVVILPSEDIYGDH